MSKHISPILAPAVRSVSPLALVIATYLLFAGHNTPGGGFSAGLVIGAVVALRSLSGLPVPSIATPMIAIGIIVIGLVAAAPLLFGDPLLDQSIAKLDLPLFGVVKSGSALPFDLGVTAIVVGLVIAQLDHATTQVSPTADEGHRYEEGS